LLSLSARRAWIEIRPLRGNLDTEQSLSARRAWIEICKNRFCPTCQWRVALRKESVDRNQQSRTTAFSMYGSLSARRAWIEIRCRWVTLTYADNVALRKESVDRNLKSLSGSSRATVALRKESVDRNAPRNNEKPPPRGSLSARRAWIEIFAKLPIWEM